MYKIIDFSSVFLKYVLFVFVHVAKVYFFNI